jgi:hypothetical protein
MDKQIDTVKAEAIALGELSGEAYAASLYAKEGINAIAATLRPREFEGYAKAFYELWQGGDEQWTELAMKLDLARAKGAHPHYQYEFDVVFARGARRWAEMLVRGYLDARAGVPFDGPTGESIAAMEERIKLRRRRVQLGDRPPLIAAYEAGHQLYKGE